MKKIISTLLLVFYVSFAFADINLAWKIDGKFIKPECLTNNNNNHLFLWESFDNYQEFYGKYMGVEGY